MLQGICKAYKVGTISTCKFLRVFLAKNCANCAVNSYTRCSTLVVGSCRWAPGTELKTINHATLKNSNPERVQGLKYDDSRHQKPSRLGHSGLIILGSLLKLKTLKPQALHMRLWHKIHDPRAPEAGACLCSYALQHEKILHMGACQSYGPFLGYPKY